MKLILSIQSVLVFGALLGFGMLCQGAYLESDIPSSPSAVVPPPPPIDEEGSEVREFIRDLWVGEAVTYRDITLYPLFHRRGDVSRRYLPMEEALKEGDLILREKPDGVVSEVLATNRSRRFVFLLAGEMLVGGKQNRILQSDVILPPGSEDVVLPVYCVEKGRWDSGNENGFSGLGYLSSSRIRQGASEGLSQEQIWGAVDETLKIHGVESSTQDHCRLFEADSFRERFEDYRRGCRPVLEDGPVGMAIIRGRTIAAAEVFVDADLLKAHWEKILGSCISDWPMLFHSEKRRPFSPPGREEVRRFLRGIDSARFIETSNPGVGTLQRIRGIVTGSSLVHRNEPAHTVLRRGYRIMETIERER